ncbi:ATP synthase subunit gamma, mitochondrial [Sparganum proliferum]
MQASRVVSSLAVPIQARGMATLKDVAVQLKSIKNIQKITASMKMVASAKFARADRELRRAIPYGSGAAAFYEKAGLTKQEDQAPPQGHLIIAITSDRGLCGAANSTIGKAIREVIAHEPVKGSTKLVLIGDKVRLMLARQHSDRFLLSFADVGKKPPSFEDASIIAQALIGSGFEFDKASLFYNKFKSVVAYTTTIQPIFGLEKIQQSSSLAVYDSVDDDVLKSYNEFLLSSLIFYALKEAAASEQSARMTAMESATKNAGEMIDKLTITFNRTRQAVITKELIEIISGASAL